MKIAMIPLALLTAFLVNLCHAEAKEPIKVAVIDTGYMFLPFDSAGFKLCKTGHYNYNTNKAEVGTDTMAHGSFVVSIINSHAQTSNMCFLIYKVFGRNVKQGAVKDALRRAYRAGADVVNMSLTMYYHDPQIQRLMKTMNNRGIRIFAAAGNSKKNLNQRCNRYPMCFSNMHRNFVGVGALDEDGDVAKYSNYGAKVTVYKYGRNMFGSRGTSFAAPRAAGDYIKSLNYR